MARTVKGGTERLSAQSHFLLGIDVCGQPEVLAFVTVFYAIVHIVGKRIPVSV